MATSESPTTSCAGYRGELVTVDESDAIDGALIVTVAAPDPDTGELVFEVSRNEARELIAGLAALL